jgi:hypothetical protein
MSNLNCIPKEIISRVNGETKIIYRYFDMDKKEFVPKAEIIKRFNQPCDYFTVSHALDQDNNEHQVLWAYSKKYFMVRDAEYEARKIAFNDPRTEE